MKFLIFSRCVVAAANTLAIFGTIHLAILLWLATNGHLASLNAFAILNLNVIVPALGEGATNFVLSWCIVLVVYGLTLRFLTRPGGRKSS